ncbi:MAG: DegV family protein [Firmicutes bacterium]|nr:DegV family protein [Bacillota bacterium]
MIRIVTDSTCDLPQELTERYQITVLPLTVSFGTESFRDRVDLKPPDFHARLANSPVFPTTSQVTPAAFAEVYEHFLAQGDSVVVITLSAVLSGTYQSAVIARAKFPRGNIEVIDSRGATLGLGLIVMNAARLVEQGYPLAEVVQHVQQMVENLQYLIVAGTLEYLVRGGRLSAAGGWIGSILKIKPVLEFRDGRPVPKHKIRGERNVIPWLMNYLHSLNLDWSKRTIGLNHCQAPELASAVRVQLKQQLKPGEIIESEAGCVIGAHIGPGAIAIYFEK